MFKWFKLFFDTPEDKIADPADKGGDKSGEPKVDASGEIILDWEATSKEVDKHFNLESEDAEVEDEDKSDEESDEEDADSEDSEEDAEEADDESDDEFDVDEESEEADASAEKEDEEEQPEKKVEPITDKRFRDTQKAFRQERQKNIELQKQLEEAKKPVQAPAAKTEVKTELTIDNIDPKILEKSLREHPVETQRWIVDQQTKKTLAAAEAERVKATEVSEKASRIEKSEQVALKRFPVLEEVLSMNQEELAQLKKESFTKYVFAKKTAKYVKEFEARGDEEALSNAANRAYVELSPEMIKDIQRETKQLAKQELVNKKRVLGKVSVSKNSGNSGASASRGFKHLSEDEFMNLKPEEQQRYQEESVNRRIADRNRK